MAPSSRDRLSADLHGLKAALLAHARAQRVSVSELVRSAVARETGLAANVPVLTAGGGRPEHIAALIASSAELATLMRNIHHLTTLLRQGDVEPARPYRVMLDALAGDVRNHLALAARTPARPRATARVCPGRSNPLAQCTGVLYSLALDQRSIAPD